ncbi:MAG: secretion system protein E [Gallionellales bacterium 35-53-114]|jgi:type II secretory ATPase GspE/PulE/Tfp pilus assembly ATPase PilB-like protein|nr:MAG: secretion system protein E [Gallionellales bacterium 35-53-114]OYZ62240.1 MAG: secretion system protein E [Gallionellales bacterium 24-53-125]OZB10639.1 MAG: secretion system protein E [Gallionellales bacterium 39-52-133]HQS57274.1 ATPase, T2SS/T4P/T4SS family [Gallionellaceae bacterium]HQS74538.1 ATPase, T2SS/T4P/T4SS family [Gallionellaceae bacterium]
MSVPQQQFQLPMGQLLVSKGVISEDQLRIAVQEQHKNHQPIGSLLVRLGFLSEATIRDVLSENLGKESVDLTTVIIDSAAVALIPKDVARRYQLLPLSVDTANKILILAIADPDNILALDQVRALLHGEYQLITQVASESDIVRAIDQYYGFELSIDGILHEIEPGDMEYQTINQGVTEFSQPVVRLIDALFTEAVQQGASDIHFEPENSFLRIRYRVDGVLRQVRSLHKSFWPAMVVRMKVMSGMNIAETRAPQDGRMSLRLSGRPIDFRVASHPTTHGENLVLRILDRQKGIVAINQIGLDEEALTTLKLIIAKPEGIILVTGPTGSGKTTTLYSVLNHVNTESVNIMTLEDPVEYPIPLIRQSSVNEAAKLDFASGIRSMMRQDPDIILVGEIRDHPTAEMAFRAAMTGHQVYSTLHTNSAIGAIPRLLDIGILPDIMAGNIIGIIAQRLVRVLCPHCKYSYHPDATERKLLGIHPNDDVTLYRAAGCDLCYHQGYKGRLAIMELLKMDSDLDDLVAHRASIRDLKQAALDKGFRPLASDGLQRVLQGITSLSEVARVVDLTDRMG